MTGVIGLLAALSAALSFGWLITGHTPNTPTKGKP